MSSPIYQAIRTRYHGPTNFRGSRITARAEAGSVTVGYDYALNSSDNHEAAMRALVAKFGGNQNDYTGGVFDGDYYWIASPSGPK